MSEPILNHPMPRLPDVKARLRREMLRRRADIHLHAAASAAAALASTALSFIGQRPEGAISAYFPFRGEIDCLPLLDRLADAGAKLALPAIVGPRLLAFRSWQPGEALATGVYDTREPAPEAAEVDPVLLLVPMVAFDDEGYRLGYGGGFYDIALSRLRSTGRCIAIGLAYDEQRVTRLPRELHDQPLDWMLTPSGPIRFGDV